MKREFRGAAGPPGSSAPPRPPTSRLGFPPAHGRISPPLLAAGLSGVVTVGAIVLLPEAGSLAPYLPAAALDLAASFTRMLLAYLLSLGFSLAYGYYALRLRIGERVMLPVLDILQSVPILGFFPIAIVFFVGLTGPGSIIGPNLASIFLIFTSMAWNMAFGVYESLKTLPNDLREAADSLGISGTVRIRRVLFPATTNRLVYNSILSWTGGWYFLVAAEFISFNNQQTALPGIGSFLLAAASSGNSSALVAGLILLVALIAALDLFLWRPLSRWAERFRYDSAPSGIAEGTISRRAIGAPLRKAAGVVVRYMRTGVYRVGSPFLALGSRVPRIRSAPYRSRARAAIRTTIVGTILVLLWLLVIAIVVAVYHVYSTPISSAVLRQMDKLPLALSFSLGRVGAAYFASLGIAFPLALFIARRPRAARVGLPVVEIVASVPATALFPLFVFALLPFVGFEGAAILMLITGMVWYLFFNLLSGIRSLPPDLDEAARSLGLPRGVYLRRVLLPALFPPFVTGSITAFGAGWNALIIAEYLTYGPTRSFQVLGVGQLLNRGLAYPNNTGLPLMVAALFTLILAVVTLNELLWKPLYRRATEKYRID